MIVCPRCGQSGFVEISAAAGPGRAPVAHGHVWQARCDSCGAAWQFIDAD